MTVNKSPAPTAAAGAAKHHAALLAAYRDGLGLAAVAAIRGPKGVRIAAIDIICGRCVVAPEEMLDGLWWCRRPDQARRLAAAAMAPGRRGAAPRTLLSPSVARSDVVALLAVAVKRLGVALYSDEEIAAAGAGVIARVDEEIAHLHRAGELKSVNQSYRGYRVDAAARGEKVRAYADWLNGYKAKLVREIAAASRRL